MPGLDGAMHNSDGAHTVSPELSATQQPFAQSALVEQSEAQMFS